MPGKSASSKNKTGTERSVSAPLEANRVFTHRVLDKYWSQPAKITYDSVNGDAYVAVPVEVLERMLENLDLMARLVKDFMAKIDEYEKDLPKITLEQLTSDLRAEGKLPPTSSCPGRSDSLLDGAI